MMLAILQAGFCGSNFGREIDGFLTVGLDSFGAEAPASFGIESFGIESFGIEISRVAHFGMVSFGRSRFGFGAGLGFWARTGFGFLAASFGFLARFGFGLTFAAAFGRAGWPVRGLGFGATTAAASTTARLDDGRGLDHRRGLDAGGASTTGADSARRSSISSTWRVVNAAAHPAQWKRRTARAGTEPGRRTRVSAPQAS